MSHKKKSFLRGLFDDVFFLIRSMCLLVLLMVCVVVALLGSNVTLNYNADKAVKKASNWTDKAIKTAKVVKQVKDIF